MAQSTTIQRTGTARLPARRKQRNLVGCKFCSASDVVKNGTRKGTQYWLCKICGRGFVNNKALPRKKYSVESVAGAVYAYYAGSTLDDICDTLEQSNKGRPSESTIYRWIKDMKRIRFDISKEHRPKLGDTWKITGTVLSIGGKDYRLLSVIDSQTLFVPAIRLNLKRNTEDIRSLVESACEKTGQLPATIVTVGRWKPTTASLEFPSYSHIICVHSFSRAKDGATDPSDTWHTMLKARTRAMRGCRSPRRARQILDGWRFAHNYLLSQEFLDGKTPAKTAGIDFPYDTWPEVLTSRQANMAKAGSRNRTLLVRSGAAPYRSRRNRLEAAPRK